MFFVCLMMRSCGKDQNLYFQEHHEPSSWEVENHDIKLLLVFWMKAELSSPATARHIHPGSLEWDF